MSAPDWEAIEREYRAGQLSIREIGRFYEVSDTAIRKQAKKHAWVRDLSKKVEAQAKADAVLEEVRFQKGDPEYIAKDEDLVKIAAAARVSLVLEHRKGAARARALVDTLWGQLHAESGSVEVFQKEIAALSASPETREAARALSRAMSLPGRAGAARALATALRTLVVIEREAIGLGTKGEGDEGDKENEPLVMCFDGVERKA